MSRIVICRVCGHRTERARAGDRCPTGDGFLLDPAISARHAADPHLGRALGGEYIAIDVLGSGGFGAVYRALEHRLGRSVALKMLHADIARRPGIRARFEREARAVAQLRHPTVVEIHRVGEQPPDSPDAVARVFLVLEFIEGRTLADVLAERGRLDPPDALAIARPLLEALAEAHARGIIHRDLKPSNIMLAPDSNRATVRLLDFGIAKVLDEPVGDRPPSTGPVLGTPSYMAPEQARNAEIGPASDLYALGVVLYELLSGRRPFVARDLHALLFAHAFEPVPPMPKAASVAPAVERVVHTALAKDPARRFGSAREMLDALVTAVCASGMSGHAIASAPPRHRIAGAGPGSLAGEDLQAPRPFDAPGGTLGETATSYGPVQPRSLAPGEPPSASATDASPMDPIDCSAARTSEHVALAVWLRSQAALHRQRALFWYEDAGHPTLVDQVYVELDVSPAIGSSTAVGRRRARREPGWERSRLTLAELLARTNGRRQAGRYAILGDPGAGKSTIARHLAYTLAAPDGTRDGVASEDAACAETRWHPARPRPVPVYLPLVDWVDGDIFDQVTTGPEFESDASNRTAVARRLRALAAEPHGVWLLLDGFDELRAEDVKRVRGRIAALAARWPNAAIAVFSRPIGYDPIAGFARAFIQPLDGIRQAELTTRWLGAADGPAAAAAIAATPGLAEAAGNPLMLSLLAMIWFARTAEGQAGEGPLPTTRGEVFGLALDVLMTRRHHLAQMASPRIAQPHDARRLLGVLAVALTERGGESWRLHVLSDTLVSECPETLRRCLDGHPWTGPEVYLRAVARHTGVLTPEPGGRWRFMHRALRERLAAERLLELGPEVVSGRLRMLGTDEARDALGRWGETLGIACGLMHEDGAPSPIAEVRAADPRLVVRLLPELTGLGFADALAELFAIDPRRSSPGELEAPDTFEHVWNGDTLVEMAARRPDGRRGLWAMVTDERSLDELAFLHYALMHPRLARLPGPPMDHERFFGSLRRWRDVVRPVLAMVEVAPGTFSMGSPDGEPGRFEHEGPLRRVTLTRGFRLGRTPVTRTQYETFDPAGASPDGDPEQPAVEVSWWRARLFAAWVGGRLPTEAEWEYACRAGTTSATYAGAIEIRGACDAPAVDPIAWYGGNSGVTSGGQDSTSLTETQYAHTRIATHPVGRKRANPWGLHDMLGNVWEWTRDRWADRYAGPTTNPNGPAAGENRVMRGGSFGAYARHIRSAGRAWGPPDNRWDGVGFRVALPLEV